MIVHHKVFLRFCVGHLIPFYAPGRRERIDPDHSAAMLSLVGIKALFSHGKPRPDANSVRGLPCKNKAFYSPETQHDCRVIRVYGLKCIVSFFIVAACPYLFRLYLLHNIFKFQFDSEAEGHMFVSH